MIFESLWPLVFLLAVPIIIILYLLKPKGEDYEISSNLLWTKILKNQQSKTFFEKFVQNILMYLQILIVLLLILALMSPFIRMEGKSGAWRRPGCHGHSFHSPCGGRIHNQRTCFRAGEGNPYPCFCLRLHACLQAPHGRGKESR